MKRSSLLCCILLTCFLFSCSHKSELEDFIGDHNTTYSQSLKGVTGEGFKRVFFNDLMPIKVNLFKEAQTNLVKGQIRLTYNNYVNIVSQFKKEKLYDLQDFKILGDTLEFSFGRSKLVGQIIKSSEGTVIGLQKTFMSASDFPSLKSNPLYLNERNRILYFKVVNPFEEIKLLEEFYNHQISEWTIKLNDSKQRDQAEAHINFLTDRLNFAKLIHK